MKGYIASKQADKHTGGQKNNREKQNKDMAVIKSIVF